MNKSKRIERIKEMLSELGNEEHEDGFNEFPQFCEETVVNYLQYFSEEGLKKLAEDIEDTSYKGIKFRRNPTKS